MASGQLLLGGGATLLAEGTFAVLVAVACVRALLVGTEGRLNTLVQLNSGKQLMHLFLYLIKFEKLKW